jgi:hypothetical protein
MSKPFHFIMLLRVDSDAWEGEVDDVLAWTEQLNDVAESPGAAGGVVGGGRGEMQEGYP